MKFGILLATLLFTGFAGAQKLTPVTMQLNWFAQPDFGGYFTAKADGIYEKHGLEVTLKQGGPQLNIHQLLAAAQVDFIMGSSVRTMMVRHQGVPIVAVAAFYQKDPITFMVHEGSGVEKLADLTGRPIYLSGIARISYWPWLKAKFGFTDAQVRPFDASYRALSLDKTAASQGYLTEDAYYFKKVGMSGKHLWLADYGWNPYSSTLDTTDKIIAEKPEMVAAFMKATAEGYRRYLQDPRTGNALIKQYNPQMEDELMKYAHAVMTRRGLVDPGGGVRIGSMTDARWGETFKMLAESGVLPASFDFRSAYTVRFVNAL